MDGDSRKKNFKKTELSVNESNAYPPHLLHCAALVEQAKALYSDFLGAPDLDRIDRINSIRF